MENKWANFLEKKHILEKFTGTIFAESSLRPQVFHQVTQFNEQIKSGTPIETFFKSEMLKKR